MMSCFALALVESAWIHTQKPWKFWEAIAETPQREGLMDASCLEEIGNTVIAYLLISDCVQFYLEFVCKNKDDSSCVIWTF